LLRVRRLTEADLPAITELAADRGWPPELSKWRLMLAVSEAFGVDDPAGGLAGVVVLTRYGAGLAAIGMMLVATRHGRKGLGGQLLQHALDLAGDAVVYLTATSYGRPLYERLGFAAIDTSVTFRGRLPASPRLPSGEPAGAAPGQAAPGQPAPGQPGQAAPVGSGGPVRGLPRRIEAADLVAVQAVDALVFGADRGRVLRELLDFADEFMLGGCVGGGCAGDGCAGDGCAGDGCAGDGCAGDGCAGGGYGAAWAKDGSRVIGPIVAPDTGAAARLIAALAAGWAGPVRLDILGRHRELAAWAASSGLTAGNQTALMVRGGNLPGDRSRLYCPVTVAIG